MSKTSFKVVFLVCFCTLLQGKILPYKFHSDAKTQQGKIKILDVKELSFQGEQNPKFTEISALAYHRDILYALSDKGALFHLDIKIQNDKIQNLFVKKATYLHTKKSKRVPKHKRDAEGLTVIDNYLAISFERIQKVFLFDFDGKKLQKLTINKALRDKTAYQSENKGLEAVAYSQKYGVLTLPERPLYNQTHHTLYAKKMQWNFEQKGSVTALEMIDESNVLVVLREFHYLTQKRVLRFLRLSLEDGTYEVLAKFDSDDGWNLDNFEGVTKIAKNRYLLVSDDNDSIFQKTLLVLFEILP